MELDEYHLVILRRPESPPTFTEAQLDELQASHLADLADLAERGLLALNGPETRMAEILGAAVDLVPAEGPKPRVRDRTLAETVVL